MCATPPVSFGSTPAAPPAHAMRILVVGGGGREHALLDALARSPRRPTLFVAPGNAGTAALAEAVPVAADDVDGLARAARRLAVNLVVVGPEAPLVAGLVDRLDADGIPAVGPTAACARLEGSKAFAKDAMARFGVPTAAYRAFERASDARETIESHPLPVVLKADGLAGGKGVVVATTREEARSALDTLVVATDDAPLVVEAFLDGEEASVFVVTDGESHRLLPAAQDHKRLGEGDTGPNTGGMGAYAPAPAVTPEILAAVEARVVRPMLDGMRADGTPYRGILYVGLMLTADGPAVVEFNCRLGDPEAQAVLPLLTSDAVDLFEAVAHRRLADVEIAVHDGACACVVLASAGYPGAVASGHEITGADARIPGATLYHAATARDADGRLVTAGGRVLGAVGRGDTLAGALTAAYALADAVHFDGKTLRRDIGWRGMRNGAWGTGGSSRG